jgi:hypothetical protein
MLQVGSERQRATAVKDARPCSRSWAKAFVPEPFRGPPALTVIMATFGIRKTLRATYDEALVRLPEALE